MEFSRRGSFWRILALFAWCRFDPKTSGEKYFDKFQPINLRFFLQSYYEDQHGKKLKITNVISSDQAAFFLGW